jgi:hypothetical protein
MPTTNSLMSSLGENSATRAAIESSSRRCLGELHPFWPRRFEPFSGPENVDGIRVVSRLLRPRPI